MIEPTVAPPRILIVEDEPELNEDTARALSELSYEVVGQALTGQEGIEAARRLRPDLVLMDVRLPGAMDGRDAARLIDRFFGIPIIFVTGISAPQEMRRIMLTAPYGYVLKPFGHRELLAAVELALQRWGSEQLHREREDWFERILERQRNIVAVLDRSGIVDYVNPPVQEVLGWPPEMVIGRDLLELAHAEDHERLGEAIASAFAEPEGLLEVEGRLRTESGEWRRLRFGGHRVERGIGDRRKGNRRTSVRLVVDAREVTEQASGRAGASRAEQEWYPRLFDDIVAGAFRVSELGEIHDANQALARMLGYDSRQALMRQPASRLLPDRRTRARLLAALRRERSLTNVEIRLASRDGDDVFGLLAAHLVRPPGAAEPFVIGTIMDISERKQLEHELEHLAFEDPLTDLVNRRAVGQIADRYLALARRRSSLVGLIYLDLTRFKEINDHLGHAAGDQVLREVARRLKLGARETDVACRLGGDEFLVLLPDISTADDAVEIARRVEIELDSPVPVGVSWIKVCADMGVAVYPNHGLDFEELLRASDHAMYRAKASRRAGVGCQIAVAGHGEAPPVT